MKRIVLVLLAVATGLAAAGPAAAAVKAKVAGGTLTVTGDSKGNKLTLKLKKGSPGKLQVDVGSNGSVEFTFNRSAFAAIVVNAGGGNDTVTISDKNGAFTTLENTTLNGGTGKDRLIGGAGAESFVGGTGTDTVSGKGGADIVFWTQGQGNDRVDGGADVDRVNMTGTIGADDFQILVAGSRANASVGVSFLSLGTTELVNYFALGGADYVAAGDVSDGGVTDLTVDLSVNTAGDTAVDTVEIFGDSNPNVFSAVASGAGVVISGLPTAIDITGSEAANDSLKLYGLGANDTLSGGALAALIRLTLDGGDGNDTLNGGNGADTHIGGAGDDTVDGNGGNDVAFLGLDNDRALWDPGDGSDIVEGQAGHDILEFHGSAGSEIFAASSNGGRLLFTRNVGNIVMDVDDVEELELDTLGGADTVTVNDLTATDVVTVDLDLGVGGVGDGAADSITANGTVGADTMSVTGGVGFVGIVQPAFSITLIDSEPANDTLTINGSSGIDLVNASALAATSVVLTLNGGNDGDVLIGSAGNDTVNGDAGNDVIQTLGGNDAMNCGADTDYGDGGLGTDTGANCETQVGVP